MWRIHTDTEGAAPQLKRLRMHPGLRGKEAGEPTEVSAPRRPDTHLPGTLRSGP